MPGLKKASEARGRKRANKAEEKQEQDAQKRAAINIVKSFTYPTSAVTELCSNPQDSTSESANAKRRKCTSRKRKQDEIAAYGSKDPSQERVRNLKRVHG